MAAGQMVDATWGFGCHGARIFCLGQHGGNKMEVNIHRKKWLRRLGLTLFGGGLLLGLLFFSLPWLLIRPAETARADAILYFNFGEGEDTDAYVADLYQQGLGQQIVCVSGQITWQTYPADFARSRLLQHGLPATALTTFHLPRAQCGAELAPVLLDFLKQQRWQRVLFVTHPVQSRVTQRLFANRLAHEQISLSVTYAPADAEPFRGAWWRKHSLTQKLVGTSIETVLDLFYPQCW